MPSVAFSAASGSGFYLSRRVREESGEKGGLAETHVTPACCLSARGGRSRPLCSIVDSNLSLHSLHLSITSFLPEHNRELRFTGGKPGEGGPAGLEKNKSPSSVSPTVPSFWHQI